MNHFERRLTQMKLMLDEGLLDREDVVEKFGVG